MSSPAPTDHSRWFMVSAATGAATWMLPCAIGGVREAWDWSFAGFVLLNAIAGFALGAVSHRVLVIGLGVAVAHFVCGLIGNPSTAAICPGPVVIAVLSFAPAALGAAFGRRCVRTSDDAG